MYVSTSTVQVNVCMYACFHFKFLSICISLILCARYFISVLMMLQLIEQKLHLRMNVCIYMYVCMYEILSTYMYVCMFVCFNRLK